MLRLKVKWMVSASKEDVAARSSLGWAHNDKTEHLAILLQDGKLSDVRRMGAGFAAGITEALVIVTPFEVVKIRLQQQRGMSKELLKYRVRSRQCMLILSGAN